MALGLSPAEIVAKEEYQLLVKADHWERVLLSDVAHVQNGFAFKSEFFDRDEGVPLIRIRDISKLDTEHRFNGDYDDQYVIGTGDLLIGMDGDFLAARWKGGKALLNQRVCKLALKGENYDEHFFFYCLQPYLNAINAETSSVTVKHLSSKTIEAIPLPLPPLQEQHRIVAKIEELFSELDKGIESLKTAREQLKVYRQAVLKHAFEGKLTEQWREENKDKLETADQLLTRIKQEREARYEEQLEEWKAAVKAWELAGKQGKKHAKPKKPKSLAAVGEEDIHGFPDLPAEWAHSRLGELIDEPKYGTSKKCDYESDGMAVLRIPNVARGVIDSTDLKYAQFDDDEIETYRLRRGDVLTIRSNGSISLVGKCAIVSESEERFLYAGYLIRLRPNKRLLASEYLTAILSSHLLRTQIEQRAKSTSGVNNINSGELQDLIVPACGIYEQVEIVEKLGSALSEIDATEAEIDAQLLRSESLRQSILKRAFSGQLIAQDSDDEPASVLLERIKSEKTVDAKTRKKRTKNKDIA